MPRLTLTPELARAAAQDAGNRHMREHGRTEWSLEDWNVAAAELSRLWPEPFSMERGQ